MALLEKLTNNLTAQNIYLDENTGGKGRYFKSRFLQPGLVKYSFGVCVLENDTIRKFIDGFVGCPVIINHKDVTNENAKDERVGVISRVWFDENDGWFWGEGVIFDEEALSLIESGYNVSCQYEITEYSNNTGKELHNGNPYDKVILNGKPEHLAIVKTPRYENAMIAVNALDLTEELEAENARGFGGEEGEWITVKGVHIFIKDGQSKEEAVKEFIEKKQGGSSEKKEEKKDITQKREFEHNGAKIFINPDGKYADIKIDAPKGETFKNGDTWYRTQALIEDAEDRAKKIIDGEFGQSSQKEDTSEKRKRREVSEEELFGDKTLEGGIKESHDKYGRTNFTKGNKWANVTSNGGRSDSWIAAYGLTHQSGVSWEREKGITEEQLLNSRHFKTEKGARKWALEQLKRLTSDNSIEPNAIIQAINEIKETNMFKNLFNKKEKKMDKDEMKALFMDCIQDVLQAQNEAEEEEKEDVKNEEEEEEKAANKKACNEDKRKLIDEVAGMMKSAGCDDEVIRTAIAKMEKIGYDKSEAGTADNCGKKGKNEEVEVEEEEKEEAKNKAKNSIEAMKGLLSSAEVSKSTSKYITKSQAIELGNQLF